MKRIAIFAHFDRDNLVDKYVLYYLQNLRSVSQYIVFVTTSQVNPADNTNLKTLCDMVIMRENVGYDFASWQTGISWVTNIADFDELIICNDSVYGPLYPIEDVFDFMGKKDCDFWGITDSKEIAYHLQSYFLVFRKKVITSEPFKKFWDSVKNEDTTEEIIKKYEIGLTQTLMSAGFKPCAYVIYSFSIAKIFIAKAISALKRPAQALHRILEKKGRIDYLNLNPTHYFWEGLVIKQKMPFLKVKLLRDNPARINISKYENVLLKYSIYDIDMIRQHLERMKHRP